MFLLFVFLVKKPNLKIKSISSQPEKFACACAWLSEIALERFTFEKGETRGGGTAPPGPKRAGKTAFFPRNDRPYGLKRERFKLKLLWKWFPKSVGQMAGYMCFTTKKALTIARKGLISFGVPKGI